MGQRVLGMLAGRGMSADLLSDWANSADMLLAADAGADRLFEIGKVPQWIVGDFDSVSREALDSGAILRKLEDQNTTDCEKLLALAEELGCNHLTLAGVEGDRLDHLIASVFAAARSSLDVRLALGRGLGFLIHPGEIRAFPASVGYRVSMLPIGGVARAVLRGVRWPLEGRELHPLGKSSISNVAELKQIDAGIEGGLALLIIEYPREAMPSW